jgi:hypothetical protein
MQKALQGKPRFIAGLIFEALTTLALVKRWRGSWRAAAASVASS